MPDQRPPDDRSPLQRSADHAQIARLTDALVPSLIAKLGTASLGEVEVREGDWHVRVRRPTGPSARRERPPRGLLPVAVPSASQTASPAAMQAPATAEALGERRAAATAPAVGLFRPGVPVGTAVHAGDRVATVDLLGIPLDVVSPIDGVVVEVLPQAGDGVEYGEEVALVEAPEPPVGGAGEG